jgi:dTDP-glucose pyrophosphorylase
MNLLILCAGSSQRFEAAGSAFPKNLVEIDGKPLIQHVVESWHPVIKKSAKVIVAIRETENRLHHTGTVVKLLLPDSEICECLDGVAGAACSALLSVRWIDTDEPLLIVNGDQIVADDLHAIVDKFLVNQWDGGIVTFRDVHPRWSFVRLNDLGWVVEAAEKRPISNLATAGVYYFKTGKTFVAAAKQMILKRSTSESGYYICPVYNEMILEGARIGIHEISRSLYFSLATPSGVEQYEKRLSSNL